MGAVVTKIEFNDAGFVQVLRSQGVTADIDRRAKAIAAAAGEGVSAQISQGRDRVRAIIQTDTQQAAANEANNSSLTTAIGAGRG